jgi:hypothetical protein
MGRKSLITIYFPDYITVDGSLDDDETLAAIMHYVNNVTFKEGESREVKVKVGETVYYVCPGDTRETIKEHRDRRHQIDRRKADRPGSPDRRKGC